VLCSEPGSAACSRLKKRVTGVEVAAQNILRPAPSGIELGQHIVAQKQLPVTFKSLSED
jgi:hypothetical protein